MILETNDEMVLKDLRKRIFLISQKNGLTHVASAFSCLEILYVLYGKGVLRFKPECPDWEDRDRFILSKGHAAIGMYAVMERAGLLKDNELDTFLKPGTRLGGEPCRRELPLVETSTGALGHGFSVALGMALAKKIDHSAARIYALLGDGECQEGNVWEAAMSAAAFGLDNFIAILDCNHFQKMDTTEATMKHVEWKSKWEAFGWQVTEINGHDLAAVETELRRENMQGKPRLIIAHTVKGKGVSIMEKDGAKWHYKIPTKKETGIIMEELGISQEEAETCRTPISQSC